MSKVIRSVKNVTKGYSNVQIKVREGGSPASAYPGAPPSMRCVMPTRGIPYLLADF